MTAQEKIQLMRQWEINPSAAILQLADILRAEIKAELVQEVKSELVNLEAIISRISGADGEDADANEVADTLMNMPEFIALTKARTPTKDELLALITPLIKNGTNGKDGKDGENGKDGNSPSKKELLSLIIPLIPEKAENGKTPTKTELLALIKTLIPKPSDTIPMDKIEGLSTFMQNVQNILSSVQRQSRAKRIGGGGDSIVAGSNVTVTRTNGRKVIASTGGGGTWYQDELLTRTDGTNYTLSQTPSSVVFLHKNGQLLIGGGSDYTRTVKAIVMVTPTIASDVLIATYS